MRKNFKAPLIMALAEAGYRTDEHGYSRTTFTQARKNGTRRIKLWLANDVFESPRAKQVQLEAALKRNYGNKYLGGYFIKGARGGLGGSRSFCVVINDESTPAPTFKAGDWVALVRPRNPRNQDRIARLVRPRPAHWEHTSAPGPRWEVDRPFYTSGGVKIHSLPVCNIKLIERSDDMEHHVLSSTRRR